MANKFYEHIKLFIKEFGVLTIFLVLWSFLINIELPYVVESPGGLINIDERLSGDIYKPEGSFNLTYVTVRNGKLVNVIIGLINKNWDVVKIEDVTYDNETIEESNERSKIELDASLSASYYLAYTEAGRNVEINKEKLYISYIYDIATTDLVVGDNVIKVNNKDVNSFEDIEKVINESKVNDELKFTVINKDKEYIRTAKINEQDGRNVIGILVSTVLDLKLDPVIDYKGDESESGPSGGLMFTLSIYNALTKDDITNGLKISGTGTINLDGTVGEIGGVKHKLAGSVKNKADVFIVPEGNYDEVMEIMKEKEYDIKIIKASNFKQVLEELQNLK